jgi:hypothetical protein
MSSRPFTTCVNSMYISEPPISSRPTLPLRDSVAAVGIIRIAWLVGMRQPQGPRTPTTTPSSNQINASASALATFSTGPASGSDLCDDPRLASRPAAMPLLLASRRSTEPSDQIQALNHQKAHEFDQQNYVEWP